MFHAARGGRGSVPHCPWRALKRSTLPMEGVEVFHTAHGGRGSIPRCPWRAWKHSTLPVEGVEAFHAACSRRGSVLCHLQMLNLYIINIRNLLIFGDIVNLVSF